LQKRVAARVQRRPGKRSRNGATIYPPVEKAPYPKLLSGNESYGRGSGGERRPQIGDLGRVDQASTAGRCRLLPSEGGLCRSPHLERPSKTVTKAIENLPTCCRTATKPPGTHDSRSVVRCTRSQNNRKGAQGKDQQGTEAASWRRHHPSSSLGQRQYAAPRTRCTGKGTR
jgi:hypothetical protein